MPTPALAGGTGKSLWSVMDLVEGVICSEPQTAEGRDGKPMPNTVMQAVELQGGMVDVYIPGDGYPIGTSIELCRNNDYHWFDPKVCKTKAGETMLKKEQAEEPPLTSEIELA